MLSDQILNSTPNPYGPIAARPIPNFTGPAPVSLIPNFSGPAPVSLIPNYNPGSSPAPRANSAADDRGNSSPALTPPPYPAFLPAGTSVSQQMLSPASSAGLHHIPMLGTVEQVLGYLGRPFRRKKGSASTTSNAATPSSAATRVPSQASGIAASMLAQTGKPVYTTPYGTFDANGFRATPPPQGETYAAAPGYGHDGASVWSGYDSEGNRVVRRSDGSGWFFDSQGQFHRFDPESTFTPLGEVAPPAPTATSQNGFWAKDSLGYPLFVARPNQ